MSPILNHRLKPSVCVCVYAEDLTSDPVKQRPTVVGGEGGDRGGGLKTHITGLLFSSVLY